MDSEFVGQIAAFRDTHRVNLAHEVRNGDVWRRKLFAIPLIAWEPGNFYKVVMFRDLITTSLTNRFVWIVVDFTSGNDWHNFVKQVNETTSHTRFCLTTFTKKDNVLTGENGIFNLRNNRFLIAYNPREQLFLFTNFLNEIFT